jgi:hypothetical protein
MTEDRVQSSEEFDWSHAGNQRRQRRVGLTLTPAERLAWLEEMLDELLPLVGRARNTGVKRELSRRW